MATVLTLHQGGADARHTATEQLLDPHRDWDTLLAAAAAEAFLGSLAGAFLRAFDDPGLHSSSPEEPVAPDGDGVTWVFLDVRRDPPAIGRWVAPGDPTIGCSRCERLEPFGGSPVLIGNVGDMPSGWDERTEDEWDESIGDDILAGRAAVVCRDCLTAEDLTPVDRGWFGRFLKTIGWTGLDEPEQGGA